MKEQALIGARGLVSPGLCIPVLQSVSCYRGAAVMPFSRLLWRVLGEVGLADEVRGTEAGLRTVVGPAGTRLSGGQAQRLTVARVILQRPRVLILDEFTASVDPDLAVEIRVNLARCLPGVTVVEISHECDCGGETVVLDRGRVVKHLRR